MATNSDGSIILSVKIDEDGLKPQLNSLKTQIEQLSKKSDLLAKSTTKINAELAKSQIYNEKVKQAQEKTSQAIEKTYQAIEKTNQARLKTSQLDDKTILSAEKVTQAELKTAQAQEKLNQEKAKTSQQSARQSQEEAKIYTEIFKAVEAKERVNQAAEKTYQSIEKTIQSEESTRQAFQKTYQEEEKTTQQVEKTKQAIERTTQAQEKTKQAVTKTEVAQSSLKSATDRTLSSLQKMATSLGIIFSLRQFLNFSNQASELASQTEANLKRLSMLYGEAGQEVYDFAEKNAKALGMSKTAAYDAAADYGNIFTTFASGAESAKLTTDMLQATAVIASQTGRTYEEVFEKIRSGLYGNTRAIDDLGLSVRQASLMQTQVYQTITGGIKSWNDLTDAELQQARALGILEQSHIKYGNTVIQSTALTRSQFNAAYQDFKSTWGQVVNVVLVPIMNAVAKILALITAGLKAVATAFGKGSNFTTETSKVEVGANGIADGFGKVSDNIGKSSDNQNKLNKGLGKTNKELKKAIAGFDELQILTEDKASDSSGGNTGGGTGGGAGGGGATASVEVPQLTGETNPEDYVGTWDAILGALMILVGGALIAVGLILLTLGHIAWGVGFIIAGAATVGVGAAMLAEAFNDEKIRTFLTIITAITGIILITIGLLLIFVGNIPWGIGFLVAGGTLLAVSMWAMLNKLDHEEMLSALSAILAFVAGALIAIGVILLFLGSVAWGIGFIIAGAVAFVVSMAVLSKLDTKDISKTLLRIQLIAAGFLLVLGIMLCVFSGISPISLGLIIAGIGVLTVTLANVDENILPNNIRELINKIFTIVSVAFLVLGIILCCCGIITPMSIGLIVMGALGLATELALNWDAIKNKVVEILKGIKDFIISSAILALGVMIFLTGVGMPIGIALIKKGAEQIEKTLNIDWETIKNKVKEIFNAVKDWVKEHGKLVLGILLMFTGVGIPKGMGLIKEATTDLADENPVWDTVYNKIEETWNKVKEFWNTNISKYFTSEWWSNLAKTAVSGFVKKIIGGLNSLISKINGFGFNMPEVLGGKHIGFNIPKISVPGLAKGAVLPANQPFLALLGDQRRGTNIEAPLDTIKQAVSEVLASEGYNNNSSQTVILELDGREVGRTFGNILKQEQNRVGNNFVKTSLTF